MYETPSVRESDWKVFRKKAPEWEQAVLDRLNQAYIQLLCGPETPAEKFWTLRRRINKDVHRIGVSIEAGRSTMEDEMGLLLRAGAITPEDLDGFSADLRGRLEAVYRDRWGTAGPEEDKNERGETE